jgi:SAM-dependent methyltransferase
LVKGYVAADMLCSSVLPIFIDKLDMSLLPGSGHSVARVGGPSLWTKEEAIKEMKIVAFNFDGIYAAHFKDADAFVELALDHVPKSASRVLDMGCGTGILTFKLSESFQCSLLVGVDCSPELLTIAREKAAAKGHAKAMEEGKVVFRELDITSKRAVKTLAAAFPDGFDIITSLWTVRHLHKAPEVVRMWADELLAPGGRIILDIEHHNKDIDTYEVVQLRERIAGELDEPRLAEYPKSYLLGDKTSYIECQDDAEDFAKEVGLVVDFIGARYHKDTGVVQNRVDSYGTLHGKGRSATLMSKVYWAQEKRAEDIKLSAFLTLVTRDEAGEPVLLRNPAFAGSHKNVSVFLILVSAGVWEKDFRAPCFCGSGKKYKKCHAKTENRREPLKQTM